VKEEKEEEEVVALLGHGLVWAGPSRGEGKGRGGGEGKGGGLGHGWC